MVARYPSKDKLWDAPVRSPMFRTLGLTKPKPDYAFGLRVLYSPKEASHSLSRDVIDTLEKDADLDLHPRPSPVNLDQLAYPGLVHEVKDEFGTQAYAENQLAKSLAFALDQQKELRLTALNIEPELDARKYNLPIFGITSVGSDMRVFLAFLGEDDTIVSKKTMKREKGEGSLMGVQ